MGAPIRLSDLCVALRHEWLPDELFMTFTGYFDESGTHGGSPVSAMGGFIASARQWREYEKRSRRLFRRFGVNTFHAIDVRRGHKNFKGWTVDRKIEFIDEFQHILNETMSAGIVAFIRNDDYAYYRTLGWPKRTRPDSKYTIMMRACLAHTVDVVGRLRQAVEPRLYIVLEAGHKNAEDAVRCYEWVAAQLGRTHNALSGITFGTKEDCLPLAAADHLAYTAWGEKVGQKPLGEAKGELKSAASYSPGHVSWIDLNRDNLKSLHEQAIMISVGADPRRGSFFGQYP